ncbi:Ger(x)C family spore germination protein [Sedimentibacter sp. MB31-C6]|uniref:Ger(x)C family spore germination protein n=1 Tax=Sedimentibacter sp. MB31-C6 TaxID=3109366 RepID=UPI002DDD2F9A|nr:Ger(x)C family spore germination protein [Sedimentibacter sp. MB36-C1]WSI05418.1 Ger(x)C family spore germination protein [Sedimentibacter sp. MB36-C1]
MKKIIILIIITLTTVLLLTGCWDSIEINDREYLIAIGIDKIGDTLRFTAEIPKINEGDEQERLVFSEESENFSNFYRSSFLRSDKVISDRLMQIIVIGEEAAKDPDTVKKIFDEIQRSPEMNRRVKVAIAKGEAEKIINTEIPNNPVVGRFMSDMLVKLKRQGYQDIFTFDEAILHLGQVGNVMVPVVEQNEDSLKINSAAIVKDYKLVGFLNNEELEIIMLLLDPLSSNLQNINIEVDNKPVSLGAVNVSMTDNIKLENEKLTADYYITLYCYIESYILGDTNLGNQNYLAKIRQEGIKNVSDNTTKTIDKLQDIYKTDLLRLKDKLYKHHRSEYEKISDKYDDIFAEANINVHYNMQIKSIGLVK